MNIFVYSKKNCPNCVAAKNLLKAKGLSFVEQSMDNTEVRLAFEFAYPNVRGLPQIFIDDQHIGGLLGLHDALRKLKL
jgi:glutaredoxin 3